MCVCVCVCVCAESGIVILIISDMDYDAAGHRGILEVQPDRIRIRNLLVLYVTVILLLHIFFSLRLEFHPLIEGKLS